MKVSKIKSGYGDILTSSDIIKYGKLRFEIAYYTNNYLFLTFSRV